MNDDLTRSGGTEQMPEPYRRIRHPKWFWKQACGELLVPFAAIVFAIGITINAADPTLSTIMYAFAVICVIYAVYRIGADDFMWRNRPLAINADDATLRVYQKGSVLWLVGNSDPDAYPLSDFVIQTPNQTIPEQLFFKRSQTMVLAPHSAGEYERVSWLQHVLVALFAGMFDELRTKIEYQKRTYKVFTDVVDVGQILAIQRWHLARPLRQQDAQIRLDQDTNDQLHAIRHLLEGRSPAQSADPAPLHPDEQPTQRWSSVRDTYRDT